jgi:Tol biopolymer transport system component
LLICLLVSLGCVGSCKSKSNEPEPVVIKQIWYTPAWSPDGTEIACFVRRGGIFISILDAVTGEVRRERSAEELPLPFAFSWTPDGKWLLFGASPGIFKLTSDLDSLVQLTSGQFHDAPSYSRAREVVFFTINNPPNGGLFSITLDGDSLRRWSTQETSVLGTASFPDESDSLVGFDTKQAPFRLILFGPDAIGSALFLGGASDDPIAHISADHRYVAYNRQISGSRDLVLLDRVNNSSRAITSAGASEEMSFSPDGSQLVFPVLRGKEVGLWILDLATGEQTRLTDGTQ